MFNGAGEMEYFVNAGVFEDGFTGDTLTVNGAIAPVAQTVPTGLTRLRILNACNARFLSLSMETGPITVIASDGGFLSSTVQTDSILMSPGERYEILVDLRTAETNSVLVDMNGDEGGFFGVISGLLGTTDTTALTLTRSGEMGFDGAMPNTLANIPIPNPNSATVTRSFELNMGGTEELAALAFAWGNFCGDGGVMSINGQPMKMDRIDERVEIGATELWRISVDDQLHPFHVHGCSFQILTQNGTPPPAYAQGWKDMVHVEEGWSEILVTFDYEAPENAPYMYHCHILEHEDCGMMGQFTVT
ncbi:MAG: multicopper oxidase domain-containing protein, partial [Pseudomonadota bacterium]